jgi:hypothetical protein
MTAKEAYQDVYNQIVLEIKNLDYDFYNIDIVEAMVDAYENIQEYIRTAVIKVNGCIMCDGTTKVDVNGTDKPCPMCRDIFEGGE